MYAAFQRRQRRGGVAALRRFHSVLRQEAAAASEKEGWSHTPVLVKECLSALRVDRPSLTTSSGSHERSPPHRRPRQYLDMTFGCGGHARAILEMDQRAIVWGMDRDEAAVARARPLCDAYKGRLQVAHRSFADLRLPSRWPWPTTHRFDGILLDIGVSSTQIDDPARGFSYRHNGPLDMRMDRSQQQTAASWINTASVSVIAHALKNYGGERYANEIAQQIVKRRPLQTTSSLVAAIYAAIGGNQPEEARKHPARRTFQAIRIAVNHELDQLRGALDVTQRLLRPRTGRLALLTYHSLEEAIVRDFQATTMSQTTSTASTTSTTATATVTATTASTAVAAQEKMRREGRMGWDAVLGDLVPPAGPSMQFDALVMNAAGKEQRLNPRARSARLFAATRTAEPPIPFPSPPSLNHA